MNRADRPRRRWTWALKAIVTVCLLGALFWRIDLGASLRAIRDTLGPWLIAAVFVSFLLVVVSVLKWHALLKSLGIVAARPELLRLYFMGWFAGLFLPGVVGGDVLRWHLAVRSLEGAPAPIAASIVVERASGAAAVVLLSTLVLIARGPSLATLPTLVLVVSIGAALVGLLIVGSNRRWAIALAYRGRHLPIRGPLRFLVRFRDSLGRFPPSALLLALGYGVVFYVGNGLVLLLLCRSLDVDLVFLEAFSAQVLTNLLALLPVSLSGLGLFQVGHVYFLGLLGVAAADSLAMSLVKQAIHYAFGLVGGGLLLSRPFRGTDVLSRSPGNVGAAPRA